MSRIGILGAGTWGIALARMLDKQHDVIVWSAFDKEIEQLKRTRTHHNLPGINLAKTIAFTSDMQAVCTGKEVIVFAVPSVFIRETAKKAKPFMTTNQIVVVVAKGIEKKSLFTMSEVLASELQNTFEIVVLSGPTHAEEVALDLPTTIVAAGENNIPVSVVSDIFSNESMRVYTSSDIKGVELCGAAKNIISLGAGILSGLGYGDNAKAALITRGIAEIERLGISMGCVPQTFKGLAGIGDLIVTATSKHSRNNKCGQLIGKGLSVDEAIKQTGMVVEGIHALEPIKELALIHHIDMPIVFAVDDIVNERITPIQAASTLMNRRRNAELEVSACQLQYENYLIENVRKKGMKRVITYGTFDLLHYGHINLLKRAKALGDYLIVVVSSDEFNWVEKKKKCYFTYEQRKALVEAVRYVELVIPETTWAQKKSDVHEYHIDTFVMGDDWKGKFDFLRDEGVEVVYLPRTPEISSSQIKHDLNTTES